MVASSLRKVLGQVCTTFVVGNIKNDVQCCGGLSALCAKAKQG